jgi:predicted O-methyltransferase YrrM
MPKTLEYTDKVFDYLLANGVREHPVLTKCRQETSEMGRISGMQIAPEQGAFMGMIAKAIGAKRYLEIGSFTGYSALAVTLALPPDGHTDCLDISEEFIGKARGYWAAAGFASKITAHIAPAKDTLDKFLKDGRAGSYDLAFIDADKTGYDAYYERVLQLLRKGGVLMIDNVLWSGRVADTKENDADTTALRALNAKIHGDNRVDAGLLPLADGIYMCVKR